MAEFGWDQARTLNLAIGFLQSGQMPLRGIPTSSGIDNSPLLIYLMALPMALWRDAAFASGMVAMLNVLALFLTYRFTSRYFGKWAGIVVALLYSASVWAVIYSRKIWGQELQPPLTVLFIWMLAEWLTEGRRRSLPLAFLLLSLLVQLHPSAMALAPVLVIVIILGYRRISWPHLGLGALLFLLPFTPYLIGEAQTGWGNLHRLLSFMGQASTVDADALMASLKILSVADVHEMLGLNGLPFLAAVPFLRPLEYASLALFLAGLAFAAVRFLQSWRPKQQRQLALLMLLWYFVPVLFFTRHSYPLYPHYFVFLYPMPFIVSGHFLVSAVQWCWKSVKRFRLQPVFRYAAAPALVALILGISGGQAIIFSSMMDWVEIYGAPQGYGVPAAAFKRAVAATEEGTSRNALLTFYGNENDIEVLDFFASERPHVQAVIDNGALAINQSQISLVANPESPVGRLIEDSFAGSRLVASGAPGIPDAFSLYRLPPNAPDLLLNRPEVQRLDARLSNGITLLGYELPKRANPGDSIELRLYWRIDALPERGSYAFFNHLVDALGKEWGQTDGIGYENQFWQQGDFVMSRFTLQIDRQTPPGPLWLKTGLYDRVGPKAIPFEDGNDSIALGPVLVHGEEKAAPAKRLSVTAGESIRLLGYDLLRGEDGSLQIQLHWQAEAALKEDCQVFVHALDKEGKILAQADGVPAEGRWPTSLWAPNEPVIDRHVVSVGGDQGPVQTIAVGLYSLKDGKRLTLVDDGGRLPDDRLLIPVDGP
ncbi:MAG: glycosyltransferase family 39 protein [Chloroflexi bacterium]|nr:glycosyltransferase family 39 protein [Chloroflexota bacterium]